MNILQFFFAGLAATVLLTGCNTLKQDISSKSRDKSKIRTIITQDAEIDDKNSLIHILLYSNEFDIQGIVQTASKFHWQGVPGIETPTKLNDDGKTAIDANGNFDNPYRWPGTDWMFEYLNAYADVYDNLKIHEKKYPTPEYLRSIIKVGNIGYEGEIDSSTEGSNLIKETILDNDPRTLYLQAWGGTNTIVRALMDIETIFSLTDEWDDLHNKITKKIVITACGEQDKTYRTYLAENWPGIKFVNASQMGSYAYLWNLMPEDSSKDTLRADYMKKNLTRGHGPLLNHYGTWADGKYYEGEVEGSQFGSNPDLLKNWWGSICGLGKYKPYEFISEGDSPTFFMFFNTGLRSLESLKYGGFSGRYKLDTTQVNQKGEKLNYWVPVTDKYTNNDGSVIDVESSWKYIDDIQNDFSSRADWSITGSYDKANHAPKIFVKEGVNITAVPGELIELNGVVSDPDGDQVSINWSVYSDASTYADTVNISLEDAEMSKVSFVIPENTKSGSTIHLIARAMDNGEHNLTHYQQVIVTVE